MTTMQHSEGVIKELSGERCDRLIGVVEPSMQNAIIFAMMRSGNKWFRFTIDVGVLFFEPSEEPSSSGEIGDDDEVLNLLPAGGSFEIKAVCFRKGVLEIASGGGGSVRFHEDAETSTMRVNYPGQ